ELTASIDQAKLLNIELACAKAQLEEQVEDLSSAASDLSNLIRLHELALVTVDHDLRILRYSGPNLLGLRPSDVGRSLITRLPNLEFEVGAREVLDTLIPCSLTIPRSFGPALSVRIGPYR